MNEAAVLAYPLTARLEQEHSVVLMDLEPIFSDLVGTLAKLPDQVRHQEVLSTFRSAILRINAYADDIETVEREAILDIVYDLGTLVGLSADGQFAEEWRGDW